jgi:hypothetical protein
VLSPFQSKSKSVRAGGRGDKLLSIELEILRRSPFAASTNVAVQM